MVAFHEPVAVAVILQVRIMFDNIRELRQRSSLPPLFVNVVLALFMQTASETRTSFSYPFILHSYISIRVTV
jgi:hypothetical protein